MTVIKSDAGLPLYPAGLFSVYETYKAANSFTAGVSPVTWAIKTDLNGADDTANLKRGNRGYIVVDGAGDLLVEIAHEGTAYLTQFTLKNGDRFDLTGLKLANIRFTHSGTNTNFRGLCW